MSAGPGPRVRSCPAICSIRRPPPSTGSFPGVRCVPPMPALRWQRLELAFTPLALPGPPPSATGCAHDLPRGGPAPTHCRTYEPDVRHDTVFLLAGAPRHRVEAEADTRGRERRGGGEDFGAAVAGDHGQRRSTSALRTGNPFHSIPPIRSSVPPMSPPLRCPRGGPEGALLLPRRGGLRGGLLGRHRAPARGAHLSRRTRGPTGTRGGGERVRTPSPSAPPPGGLSPGSLAALLPPQKAARLPSSILRIARGWPNPLPPHRPPPTTRLSMSSDPTA